MTPADLNELRGYIDSDRKTEKHCQRYLERAADHLTNGVPGDVTVCSREETSRVGIADFVLVVRQSRGDGLYRSTILIWEVKAPQDFVFERATDNRLHPSADLARAESQLISYAWDLEQSSSLRSTLGVHDRKCEVVPAGIIIGRDHDRLIKDARGQKPLPGGRAAVRLMYDDALEIRRKYLYGRTNIQVQTWTWLLDRLEAHPAKPSRPLVP